MPCAPAETTVVSSNTGVAPEATRMPAPAGLVIVIRRRVGRLLPSTAIAGLPAERI